MQNKFELNNLNTANQLITYLKVRFRAVFHVVSGRCVSVNRYFRSPGFNLVDAEQQLFVPSVPSVDLGDYLFIDRNAR